MKLLILIIFLCVLEVKMLNSDEKLFLVAATVKQEAEGEPYRGKLAVAHVILNRMQKWGKDLPEVIFKPWQFTCWQHDSPTRCRLDKGTVEMWADCKKAASAAYYGLEADPTKGSTHYLNEKAVLKAVGKLPSWFSRKNVKVVIANHTFLTVD